MQGKYHGNIPFRLAQLKRAAQRAVLRPLTSWRRLDNPEPGYTVIIGAVARLPQVLSANLAMIEHQASDNLREIIVVFDQSAHALPADFEQNLRAHHPDLPLRFLYYSPWQARVLHKIGWGWCYSWLSWSLGIAACKTRYALLHDLDAMLLRGDILEQYYQTIRERGHEYVGRRAYHGNGVEQSDGLAVTFELMFDAAYIRYWFKPIALFNYIGWHRGRTVDFDTFLWAQAQRGRISMMSIDEEDLVHPSQVFCQYTEFKQGRRGTIPPKHNNMPMLLYLFYVGGDPEPLRRDTEMMRRCPRGQAVLFEEPMDVSLLTRSHVDWLLKQAGRVERVVAGEMRDEVCAYFEALRAQVISDDDADEPEPVMAATDSTDAADSSERMETSAASASTSSSSRTSATMVAEAPRTRSAPATYADRVELHGVSFDPVTEMTCVRNVCEALEAGRGGWIVTPNLDHLRRARKDGAFRAMLSAADMVVADGMPLIWASRLQGTPLPQRVAGSSLVSTLAEAAAARRRSIFLLGGEPGAAADAAQVLQRRFPGLEIAGHLCPPVGFENDREQMDELRSALREANPDMIYVALGSPKQERLIQQLREELPGAWWIGVGISLSFLSGRVKRAPVWMQKVGLEWVHRLAQEPRRLARRYLIDGIPFAACLLTAAAVRGLRRKLRMTFNRTATPTTPPDAVHGARE